MSCIETNHCRDRKGYGRRQHDGKLRGAHRVAFVEAHGITHDDIAGLHVMHSCDNPSCINPDHLGLGTNQDNVNDKMAKGRWARRHKPRKHTDADILEAFRLRSQGLLLRQVAEITGIKVPYLSRLLRGKRGEGRQLK